MLTTSIVLVLTPKFKSLRMVQSWLPSIKSRAGAPSLVACSKIKFVGWLCISSFRWVTQGAKPTYE